jgi:WD40 repeat protein
VPFRSYADELRQRIVETLDLAEVKSEELATRHDVAVSTMLDGQLQLLADDERRLLTLAALCPESAFVSRPRLRLFFEGARSPSILVRPFDRAVATLEDLHLVEAFSEDETLRLHPVVRAFVVNVTTNDSELKSQAAHNLRSAYSSAEGLVTEHERRGAAAVAEDAVIGAEWARADGEDSRELRALSQVLNRELVHVERTHGIPADRDTFIQQLHWRSIQTDHVALGETMADVLAKSSSAHFLLRAIAPADDPALVRATIGPFEDPDVSSIRGIRARARQDVIVTLDWSSAVVWNLRRLQPLHRLKHPGREYLHAAMLTPDGRGIWTADSIGRVMRWDARSGERISELSVVLEGDAYAAFELRHVAFAADCSLLVAAYDNRKLFEGTDSDNGTAIVARWSLPDGTPEPPLVLDTPWLNAVAVDDGAHRAAMGGPANGTVAIWDLDNRVRVRVYEGYSSHYAIQRPSALAFDARGDVVVATINETWLSWDVSSGHLLREANQGGTVADMVVRSDGAMMACCAPGAIRVGDVRGQSPVRELRQSSPSAVAFVEGTDLLLSGASQGTLTLWDLRAPPPRDAAVHAHSIRRLAFGDAGTSLYSACGLQLIHWNVADGASTPIAAFPRLVDSLLGDREHPTIDPFGRFTSDDAVDESGAVHVSFLGEPISDEGNVSLATWPRVTDVDVDPTGANALVSTVYGATIYLSDARLALWGKRADSPVVACAFAGDGQAIVGHLSGRVIVRQTISSARAWRFETGYEIAGLVASRGASRAMLFGDGPITVVDLVARRVIMAVEYRIHAQERHRLSGTDDWAQRPMAAAMSANGRIAVVSLGLPGLVVLDVESRTMCSLGQYGRVTAIALSDDGKFALLGGAGGWASLLDTDMGEPIADVRIDEGVSALALDGNTFAIGDLRGRVAIGTINGIPASAPGVRQTSGAARLEEEGVWSIGPTGGAPSPRSRQRGDRR